MDEQRTCGQGLAEHAALPAKLAELTDAVAETLERHQEALDLSDESSRREHAAYVELAQQHRSTAAELRATAAQMAGYRGLPMGRHDPAKLTGAKAIAAFDGFVRHEEELLSLLRARLEGDRAMLAEMDRATSAVGR
ncbi:MAG: hypothetical protein ACREOG_14520 [Gemmatimonadaceae bacterium]